MRLATCVAFLTALLISGCGGRTRTVTGNDGATTDGTTGVDGTAQPDGASQTDSTVGPDATAVQDGGGGDGGNTCASHGGICMQWHWEQCPVGREPYLDDQPLDCNGRCCVPAPASSCTNNPNYNCLLGSQCPTCWMEVNDPGISCEEGRVCCWYACD